MKREYEVACVFRVDPNDEVINQNLEQVKSLIEADEQGTVNKIDRWGRRKLAYEIDRQREGYYVFYYADINPAHIPELEREFNLSQDIIRYLFIRPNE